MNKSNRSFDELTELVFENKNKIYGAYEIRKSYNDRVTLSLFIALSFFGSLTLIGIWLANTQKEIPVIAGGNDPGVMQKMVEYIIPEPLKPQPKIEQKPESAPQTESGQMTVTDDATKTNNKPNDEQLISKNPNPDGKDSLAKDPTPFVPEPLEVPKTTAIEKVVDKMPEFEDMSRFIARNLHYPAFAVEKGTTGTVFVSFVVELDGTVSNIEIIKAIGDGCEQEAARVVKLMKDWKPGINHGKPVRVQCSLPIRFSLK